MHAVDVSLDRLPTEGIGPVDPHADLRPASRLKIPAIARRDFHGQADLAALHAAFQLHIVVQRRAFDEVVRATDVPNVVTALVRFVTIQGCETQVLDVKA